MRVTKIDHFSRQHRLLLGSIEVPYWCDGCKELGFGLCYQCPNKDCNFHLHEQCGIASPSFSHQFLETCNFKFYPKNPKSKDRYCDACGMDINGFLYQCSHQDAHDLHPGCAKLPMTLSNNNGVKIYLSVEVRSKCLRCKRKEIANGVKGWSYVSSCGKYCYHVACVKEAILENWKKGYFQSDVANVSNGLELENIGSSLEVALLPTRESSWRRKASKVWLIVKLVVSAVFGDPVTLISSLAQALWSN